MEKQRQRDMAKAAGIPAERRKTLFARLWDAGMQRPVESPDSIRSRLLLAFGLLSLLVNSLYAVASLAVNNSAGLRVSLLTVAILLVVLVSVIRQGWRRWTGLLYLVSAVVNLVLFILLNGAFHSAITIWIPFIPMLGMLLLDRRDGVAVTLVAALAISGTAVYVEQHTRGVTYLDALQQSTSTLFSIAVTSLATLGVMLIYVHLRDMYAERQRREREAKETLLRILCHDIANNLSIIRFSTAQMEEEPEHCGEVLRTVRQASEGIIEMVETVRSMRAMEDGKLLVRLAPVDLRAALEHTLEAFRPRAEQKGVALHCELPPPGYRVQADRVSLEQTVLGNLLSNAIKFTPAGRSVCVSTRDGEGQVSIAVRDEGIGIPDALIPGLFEPGKHTSRQGTDGEPGTGFGLPLVRQFVEHFGGTLSVEPAGPGPEEGTCFTVTLPVAHEDARSASEQGRP